MPEICPYCHEEQNALKNHVRLSSGGGHGSSGGYPDNFEGETTAPASSPQKEPGSVGANADAPVQETPARRSQDADGTSDEHPPDTVEMSSAEIDELVAGAAAAGRSEVREAGETDTQQEQQSEQVDDSVNGGEDAPTCGKCGGSSLIRPDRARQALGKYYHERSVFSVVARRRLKKIDRGIRKRDPSYVCPNCWTAFA